MTTTVSGPKELLKFAGTDLGTTSWHLVPQADINLFARATHDDQWIHTDVERAKTGPFGETIAHGYLTLALFIPLWAELLVVENLSMAVNYGLNKVRFPAPLPSGSNIRLAAKIADVVDVGGGGYQLTIDAAVECDRTVKPVAVAQVIIRAYE